jgi:NAD(P)-dependent dehydrogenase (short-subunit alcohol dehydrogenase family)
VYDLSDWVSQKAPHLVVVGGTSGIGEAVARIGSERGDRVTVVGRRPESVARIAAGWSGVEGHAIDITDRRATERLFQTLDPIDRLVITAADLGYGPYLATDWSTAQRMVDVKIWGYAHVTYYAAPKLSKTAAVVLTSGLAAWKPRVGDAWVALVNGAVEGLGRALAVELAPVRVNVVVPGLTLTPAWNRMDSAARDEMFRATAASLLSGRVALPEDIARAIYALLDNPQITGQIVHVDGGALLV